LRRGRFRSGSSLADVGSSGDSRFKEEGDRGGLARDADEPSLQREGVGEGLQVLMVFFLNCCSYPAAQKTQAD
jgi:hypothetical protein